MRSIAGTEEFDTAEACGKVTPLDYKGRLTFWYQGVFEGDPDLLRQYYKDFFEAFRKTYPNIQLEEQALTYNDLLDKFRTALLGNAAPMAVRLQILGGTEFASKGYLEPLKPEDVGWSTEDFWPGAMKAVTWDGVTYGIPTNNETMALIWNADIFKRAGLDPDKPPATWDDVVTYSKQIHDKLGIAGYGLVARKNAGNTPYRFMPQLWGYGGGVFDEADPNPTYGEIRLNSEASKRALQASYDMYVRDKSVPVSALTNQQADNQPLFVAGQLGMMISHPSDYNVMLDLQKKATGADKDKAQTVIDNMRYGLIPTGPDGKRAVVFGGSNIHILKPEYVEGGKVDEPAAKAHHLLLDQPGMVAEDGLCRLEPGQPQRLQDQVDEGTSGQHQVPRRHDLDAALRHPVPGPAASSRDHEHHRPGHAAERPDRRHDGRPGGRRRGREGQGADGRRALGLACRELGRQPSRCRPLVRTKTRACPR